MTVYVDVLFAVNMIINFILLAATGKITKQTTSTLRITAGAFAGAVYAVCMFFPQIKILYSVSSKIAVSFILIAITFDIRKFKTFFKTVAVFYITSFIFGGISLGLFYFTDAGKGTVVSNGIFYYNLSLRLLVISSAISYCTIRMLWKVYRSDRIRDFKKIHIYLFKKEISLNALVDTGNMLTDPITRAPVIIAEFEKLKNIFPNDFNDMYLKVINSPENLITDEYLSSLTPRLRIIPYSSLGAGESLLLGFKPDMVRIEKNIVDNVVIGISDRNLSKNYEYSALLNPEIISGGIL